MPRKSPSGGRAARTRAGDDAISMLMKDHKKVQKLFREFEKAHDQKDTATCQEIAQLTCAELEVHTTLEEELFYPAAREALGDDSMLIDEAEIEHQSAKDLIVQLRAGNADEQMFAATFTVLAEYVKHHIKEEEEEMFPALKKAKLDIASLGEAMQARKLELTREAGLIEEDDAEHETSEPAEEPRSHTRVAG